MNFLSPKILRNTAKKGIPSTETISRLAMRIGFFATRRFLEVHNCKYIRVIGVEALLALSAKPVSFETNCPLAFI